jgi:protein-tyrosine phosphatase
MPSVLFVCLGNICRSPTAEAVFKDIVAKGNFSKNVFLIDSCGTGGGNPDWFRAGGWAYHEGEASDARMTKEAKKRGYQLTSRARSLTKKDIETFDYIICMEDKNKQAVLEAAEAWGGVETKELAKHKICMMCSYCTQFTPAKRVPDPWYEGGFDHVLDLLEDACQGLYKTILAGQ